MSMATLDALDSNPRRTRSSTFSPVWNYFTKGTKNGQFYEATCNFCQHHFTWGKAGEMISHIRNRCPQAPLDARNDPDLVQGPPKPRKNETPRRAFQDDEAAPGEDVDLDGQSPAAAQSATAPTRRSRPRKAVWNFFHMGKSYHNTYAAKCRYCGKEYVAGIPESMVNHLVKSCVSVPSDIKDAFISDPSGETAREIIAESGIKFENNVEWNESAAGAGSIFTGMSNDPEREAGESSSSKRMKQAVAIGRKPGTGQTGMGRSRNTVWEHFNTGTKRGYFYEIFCKYCPYTTQTGVPVKMVEHLKTRCPDVPDSVKNQDFYRPDRHTMSNQSSNGHALHTRSRDNHNGSTSSGGRATRYRTSCDSDSGNLSAVTRAIGLAAATDYSLKRGSDIMSSRSKRTRSSFPTMAPTMLASVGRSPSGVDKEKFEQALSRYIVMCGIPLSCIEHPAFRQLLLTLNPSLVIPSPMYVSDVVTECEIIRVESLIQANIEAAVYITLGLKLVGDPMNCQLLVVILTCIDENGHKHPCIRSVDKVPDFSASPDVNQDIAAGSRAWISQRVREHLAQIGSQKVVGVVCDNAVCHPGPEDLPRSTPVLCCVLQFFENFLTIFFKHGFVVDLVESCQHISSFVSADVMVQEKMAEFGFEIDLTSIKCGFQSGSALLNSYETMRIISENGDAIRKVMLALFGEMDEADAETINIPDVMAFVGSDDFWLHLNGVVDMAAPLVAAVSMARIQTLTLADAFYFLLAHGKRLSTAERKGVVSLPSDLNRACILTLNAEFAKIDCSAMRLAYLLHPLYRGEGLYDILPDDLLVEAGEWSKAMSRTAEQTLTMVKQLRRFKSRLPPFNEAFRITESPLCVLSWWQRLPSAAGTELRQLAIRLLAISPVNIIGGPEFTPTVLAQHLKSLSTEMVGKLIQLSHFYHANADEEFRDLKAVFGSSSNVEKLSELVRCVDDDGRMRQGNALKDERSDSDSSEEEDDVALYLDSVADFTNTIFERMPASWCPPKETLKVEDSVQPNKSEEYDVRQLVLGTSDS